MTGICPGYHPDFHIVAIFYLFTFLIVVIFKTLGSLCVEILLDRGEHFARFVLCAI